MAGRRVAVPSDVDRDVARALGHEGVLPGEAATFLRVLAGVLSLGPVIPHQHSQALLAIASALEPETIDVPDLDPPPPS